MPVLGKTNQMAKKIAKTGDIEKYNRVSGLPLPNRKQKRQKQRSEKGKTSICGACKNAGCTKICAGCPLLKAADGSEIVLK